MNSPKSEAITHTPPGLFGAVIAGFNATTSNIQLLLFPIIVDVFLWLGPHLSIRGLLQPWLTHWTNSVTVSGSPELTSLMTESRPMFDGLIERFNLLGLLRTWPIGVPSLISSTSPVLTPFGKAGLQEISSSGTALGMVFIILLAGLAFGSIFFNLVALVCAEKSFDISFTRRFTWGFLQTITLTVLLVVGLVALSIPAMIFLSLMIMVSPMVAQVVLMVMVFVLFWLLLPLVFSPHGIFAYGLGAISSLLTSMRLVRKYLPGTGMFLILLFVINEGFNYLWRTPPASSWWTLVGIFGHAFITTALVAASFFYYQSGMRWMQYHLEKMISQAEKA